VSEVVEELIRHAHVDTSSTTATKGVQKQALAV